MLDLFLQVVELGLDSVAVREEVLVLSGTRSQCQYPLDGPVLHIEKR